MRWERCVAWRACGGEREHAQAKGEDGKGIVEWGLTSEERVEAHGGRC